MALDDRITIATPEGITLELVIAGIGSRFVARLLDTLIQVTIIFALFVGLSITGLSSVALIVAFALLTTFVVIWGYDVAFETLGNGRTPGKRVAGIRVVGPDGEPVSFLASAIRNIVRIVDFLPVAVLRRRGVDAVDAPRAAARRPRGRHDRRARPLPRVRHARRSRRSPLRSQAIASWDVSRIDAEEVRVLRHFLTPSPRVGVVCSLVLLRSSSRAGSRRRSRASLPTRTPSS